MLSHSRWPQVGNGCTVDAYRSTSALRSSARTKARESLLEAEHADSNEATHVDIEVRVGSIRKGVELIEIKRLRGCSILGREIVLHCAAALVTLH
jgi:hypothetical protein